MPVDMPVSLAAKLCQRAAVLPSDSFKPAAMDAAQWPLYLVSKENQHRTDEGIKVGLVFL